MFFETINLGKRYGGLWANKELNLSFAAGEIRGIIGPNGAGKSTLFNLIIGREQPSTGKIIFRGKDLKGLRPDQRARLGITIKFQITNVFDGLSVLDNMKLGLAGFQQRRGRPSSENQKSKVNNRGIDILEKTGLIEKSNELAGTLSHGEKQWLEIGIALATDPVLLLLDEPTSGMGSEETKKTADLIRRIKGELTILIIEHDMEFVRSVSEHITVLYNGGFLTEGTYEEIKTDPKVIEAYLGKGR